MSTQPRGSIPRRMAMQNQIIPRHKEQHGETFWDFLSPKWDRKPPPLHTDNRVTRRIRNRSKPPHVLHKGRKTINVSSLMAREYVGGFERGSSQ